MTQRADLDERISRPPSRKASNLERKEVRLRICATSRRRQRQRIGVADDSAKTHHGAPGREARCIEPASLGDGVGEPVRQLADQRGIVSPLQRPGSTPRSLHSRAGGMRWPGLVHQAPPRGAEALVGLLMAFEGRRAGSSSGCA